MKPAQHIRRFQRALLVVAALCLLAGEAWAIDRGWHDSLSPAERARLIALQALAALYVFTLGAVLGSFLNVVIYRMPRGMNIVRPRSRCPMCATPIELKDNIPVLGWLLLRGKCRICGGPISPRYPLVEAAVGGILLLLFWLEVRLGGVNLPHWKPVPLDELMILSWRMPWGNFVLAGYHAWLLITLLVMALIAWDRMPIPRMIVTLALAVGLLLPLLAPWLRPVSALAPGASIEPRLWWQAALDGLIGLSAGGVLGALLTVFDRGAPRYPTIAGVSLIGVFLGWQAAAMIAALITIPLVAVRLAATVSSTVPQAPALAWPTLAAWLYVPCWRHVSELMPWRWLYP